MAQTLGELVVNVIARVSPFSAGLDQATRRAKQFQSELASLAKSVVTTLGVAFSGQQLLSFMQKLDATGKAASRLGIAVEALQELQYAAELSGLSAEQLAAGLSHAQRQLTLIEQGVSARGQARIGVLLEQLGLDIKELLALRPDELLKKLADAAQQAGNKEITLTIAAQLFGAEEFANLLEQGSTGLQKLAGEAQRLGIIADQDTIARIEQFNDNMTRLKLTLVPLMLELADALAVLQQVVVKFFSALVDIDVKIKGIGKSIIFGLQNIGDLIGTAIGETAGAILSGQMPDADNIARVIRARQRALVEEFTPPPAIVRPTTQEEREQAAVAREQERMRAELALVHQQLFAEQLQLARTALEQIPLLADPTLLRQSMVGERIDTGVALRGSREAFEREAARKQDVMIELMEQELLLLRQMLDELTGGALGMMLGVP